MLFLVGIVPDGELAIQITHAFLVRLVPGLDSRRTERSLRKKSEKRHVFGRALNGFGLIIFLFVCLFLLQKPFLCVLVW